MASGETHSQSLAAAKPAIVADCRLIREFEGTFMRTCDVKRQEEGTGDSWTEFQLAKKEAQDITETQTNQNFQQLSGTLLSSTPQMTQIIIKITDKTYRKVAKVVTSKFGSLAGNAMKRKKDEDYLALFSTFATTNSPGTGNPMSFGYVSSAVTNINSNTTEPGDSQIFSVLHGRQIKDIQDEVLAGVGTYTVPTGMTEEVFRKGFRGTIANSNVFEDGNISVDATPDARGATHSREGVILCMGMEITTKEDYDIYFGGGAQVLSMVDEYSFTERTSAGTQVWAYQHFSDATAPTS